MAGTVYTVASGKGGVGKTTTSVNLAVALWQEGKAVALVDADIGMANLAAVLGLEPDRTLHDVLAGGASVDEAVVEAQGGDLLVLAGDRSLESFANADPRELRAAVATLAERCDYVVIDTGAGLSYEDVLPLGMADGVVLVTTPDPAAFGDTRKTMDVADLLGAPIRGLVVTRAVEDTDAEAIAGEIGAELLGRIPEDPAVMASTVAGNPLESHAPDSDAAAAYRDLAATILEGDPEWLEANPREPPAGVAAGGEAGGVESDEAGGVDPDEAAAAESDEETAEDDGSDLAAGEAWAAANEASDDGSGATDIGDIVAEVGEEDDAGEQGETPATDEGVVPGSTSTGRDRGTRDAVDADEDPDEAQEEDLMAGDDLGEALAADAATDEPDDDAAGADGDEAQPDDGSTTPEADVGGAVDADEGDADGGGGEGPADAEAMDDDEERTETSGSDATTEPAAPDDRAEPDVDDADGAQGPEEAGESDEGDGEPAGPGETGEEPEAPDEDDEPGEERPEAHEEREEGEPREAEDAGDAEDPDAEGDSEGEDEEETERRGGVRGWLGRLFR